MQLHIAIIVIVAAALVTGFIAFILGFLYRKAVSEKQIGSAQEEAKRIINDAIRLILSNVSKQACSIIIPPYCQ